MGLARMTFTPASANGWTTEANSSSFMSHPFGCREPPVLRDSGPWCCSGIEAVTVPVVHPDHDDAGTAMGAYVGGRRWWR